MILSYQYFYYHSNLFIRNWKFHEYFKVIALLFFVSYLISNRMITLGEHLGLIAGLGFLIASNQFLRLL